MKDFFGVILLFGILVSLYIFINSPSCNQENYENIKIIDATLYDAWIGYINAMTGFIINLSGQTDVPQPTSFLPSQASVPQSPIVAPPTPTAKDVANNVRTLLALIKDYYSEADYQFIYDNFAQAYFSQLQYLMLKKSDPQKSMMERVHMMNLLGVANKVLVQKLANPDVGLMILDDYFKSLMDYTDAVWVDKGSNDTALKLLGLNAQIKRLTTYLAVQYKTISKQSTDTYAGHHKAEQFTKELIKNYQDFAIAFISPQDTAQDDAMNIFKSIIAISDTCTEYLGLPSSQQKNIDTIQKLNHTLAKMYVATGNVVLDDTNPKYAETQATLRKLVNASTDHRGYETGLKNIFKPKDTYTAKSYTCTQYVPNNTVSQNALVYELGDESLIQKYKAFGYYIEQVGITYANNMPNELACYIKYVKAQAALVAGGVAAAIIRNQ